MNTTKTAITLALTTVLGSAGIANAGENPFGMQMLERGYQVAETGGKAPDGKCGGRKVEEAKCGANKDAAKAQEGRCGAGKDTAKTAEGKCGASKNATTKAKDGKCGEGKCGANKHKHMDQTAE